MTHIRLNTTFIANLLERRFLDGKTYAVAPCVAIVEGVLNGEFVGANVIAASVPGWNGRPVPLRHPQVNGVYVSANDPDIYEAFVIGVVYNAIFEDDRLHVELWIDEEKCQRMGGDALDVLNRLDAGDPLEVSTGYFCETAPTKGAWNDETFVAVQSHIVPDHIAVLPDQIGACNWNDGCGAPRVNSETHDHECKCQKGNDMRKNRLIQGPPTTLKTATDAEAAIATVNEDAETEVTEEAEANLEADAAEVVAGEDVAESEETAEVDAANEEETHEEDAAATANTGSDNEATEPSTNATDADEITRLAKLVKENGGIDSVNYLLWSLIDLMWYVDEIGGIEALEAVLGAMKNNVASQKAEVIAALKGNANCAFTEADLNGMTLANLEKLNRSLRPNNYAGKAAPTTTNTLKPLPAPPSWRPKS